MAQSETQATSGEQTGHTAEIGIDSSHSLAQESQGSPWDLVAVAVVAILGAWFLAHKFFRKKGCGSCGKAGSCPSAKTSKTLSTPQ